MTRQQLLKELGDRALEALEAGETRSGQVLAILYLAEVTRETAAMLNSSLQDVVSTLDSIKEALLHPVRE